MSVNSTLIPVTDVSMSTDALERGLQKPVLLSSTAGVDQASWFWAGFTHHHKTQLVFLDYGRGRGLTAQRYVNQVLQPIVLPFIAAHPGTVLQKDNARPHTARVTQNFLVTNNVQTLLWPALSPEMNPIEHVWDYMKRKIRARNVYNVQQLRQAITNEWNQLPARFLHSLVASMRRRCTELIRVNGGHTHY